MARPRRRRPDVDQPFRPIKREAPDNESESDNGRQRIGGLVWSHSKSFDQTRPRLAKRRERMNAEKNDNPQNENKHIFLH